MGEKIYLFYSLIILVMGLFIFLMSIKALSESVTLTKGGKLNLTKKLNLFHCLIIGIFLTIIIQSSSALIGLVIVFLKKKEISYRQAVYLSLGANIGTTSTAYLTLLPFDSLSYILIIIGVIFLLVKSKASFIIIYLSLIFLGILLMKESVIVLIEQDMIEKLLAVLSKNKLIAYLVGIFFTMIIQSSSALSIITCELFFQNQISLLISYCLILGSNVGTAFTAYLVCFFIKEKNTALANFNFLFNLISSFAFFIVILFIPEINVSNSISHICIFSTLFNIISVFFYIMLDFLKKHKKRLTLE